MKIGIIGMRMRPHHLYYNRKSPYLDDIFDWQIKQLKVLAKEGHTFLIGCADHWDCRAMKWLYHNGYEKQIHLILPFPGFGKKQGADWVHVREQLEHAKQVTYMQERDEDKPMKKLLDNRNLILIRESDAILWLWDGVQTDSYQHLIWKKKPGYIFPWKEYVQKNLDNPVPQSSLQY